ncbi:MAG: sugar phosphate isomerase/epimerase [Verrucomicrobiae bacterium]|nr:sugar phosphate isomerase/epimerase [Verrucomicrobiae bacterium]
MMKHSKKFGRREFLQLSALGIAGASLGLAGCATGKMSGQKKIGVGLQLYSVRNECKADFPGTLAQVAKIGYRGVEFAGYWGRSAKEVRKMLDDNGLVACGSHTPSEMVLPPDKLKATIEFNQIIGNKFIIVPDMSGATRQVWIEKAKVFNYIADELTPLGLSIGYHSHFHDFHEVEGVRPWEVFGENTSPGVILQLDTSNCCDGGADPVTELKKFPGRTRSIHIKPNGGAPDSVIGEDKIDWPAVFAICETTGGTQWYVVEHESSQAPMVAVERTFAVLKKLGKA